MSHNINQENLNSTLRFLQKRGEMQLEQLRAADPQQAELAEKLMVPFSKEDFCLAFFTCADAPAAVQLMADNGITLTEAEVKQLDAQTRALVQKLTDNDGTLSEEDLEQVAGGMDFLSAMYTGTSIICVLGAGLIGLCTGGPLGAALAGGGTAALLGFGAYYCS